MDEESSLGCQSAKAGGGREEGLACISLIRANRSHLLVVLGGKHARVTTKNINDLQAQAPIFGYIPYA